MTARGIPDGDEALWHQRGKALAGRLHAVGTSAPQAGHRISARDCPAAGEGSCSASPDPQRCRLPRNSPLPSASPPVAEPWPGHGKAAAALTRPGGYIWRASGQPSGDDAVTALTAAGVRFASSAPEPLASETVLLAA